MAQITEDWRGVVMELDNDETNNLLGTLEKLVAGEAGAAAGVTAFLVSVGISAAAVPWVAGILAVHLAWEVAAIRATNQGNGVILTMPYFTPGVLIPATRTPVDINQNWAADGVNADGTFITAGNDQIIYHLDRNAGDPQGVAFRLVNETQSGWEKGLTIRDGEGSQWLIRATRDAAGENGIWAAQAQNGQQITFSKPGFLGRWFDVFSVGGLAPLQGGDVVTFRWTQD